MSFGGEKRATQTQEACQLCTERPRMPCRDPITGSTVQTQELLIKKGETNLPSLAVSQNKMFKSRYEAQAEAKNPLPSPFQCFERGAVAFSEGERGEERRWERAAWRLSSSNTEVFYLRQEAACTERWPQRRRLTWQPHCALSSPSSSMCRTPLAAAEEKECHIQIHPLLTRAAAKKERKSNPFS